uniref:RCR-type E3 ubiquitin transferase n=1 Tax=Ditylenchus dipsaci TaxID=166011 RepID=A0A915DDX7_9BILA
MLYLLQGNDNEQDELCELCEGYFAKPITCHMRTHHAGCGGPSFSHGYNSVGNYTTGWTGTCGEGGHGNAVWYLMCPNCRMNHLKKKGCGLEPGAESDHHELGCPSNNSKCAPEVVLKRNALFLLELKPEDEKTIENGQLAGANRHQGEWTIDMFPQLVSPIPQAERPSAQMVMNEENMSSEDEEEGINYNAYKSSPYRHLSHLSDPGVFGMNFEPIDVDNALMNDISSFSASANLYKRTSTPMKLLPANTYKPSNKNRFAHALDEYMPALKNKLVDSGRGKQSTRIDGIGSNNLLRHPVMAFLVENHDLELLQQIFHTGIQRAVSFSYAFRVWNWLLKMVTSESSVSDILWHHLTAMASYAPLNQWLTSSMSTKFATHLKLLPHPCRMSLLAGDQLTQKMVEDFHAFLTTLAVVLQSPSVDIRLKCLCFRAWTFQLTIHEQNLLITLCNLLATVGAVLSDNSESVAAFDEYGGTSSGRGNRKTSSTDSSKALVKQMYNITELVQIESSSRLQLLPCLTDGSCDTFWESGDEDRNRTRRLSVSWKPEACSSSLLAVFVDNLRDEGYRVTQITIRSVEKSAPTSPARTSIKGLLHNAQVDLSYVGWIKCCVSGTNCVQIILKGEEAGCRLRQLVVFGSENETVTLDNGLSENGRVPTMKPSVSHQLLFNTAQMDAFSLFQAISAQAFSDEFAEEQNGTLRQQVLDLLFNRVQLQPLQSYVCFQMVSAVDREVVNLRERGKRNYSYVCGLMVMLVKICESRKGLEVFSLKNGLLIVLSELLLFAPQVVQIQVIETIERLIRHFKTWVFDCAQFVQNILAVLAKSISLQIKDKIAHKVYSHTLTNHALDIPAYWRMDRQVVLDVAHMLMRLLTKIANGSMSDQWSLVLRTEVANNIMHLSNLLAAPSPASAKPGSDESTRHSSATIQQLKTAQFWLSVASLAVITDANWLELCETWRILKERQSQQPDSLCENHEDGRTLSHLHCEMCRIDLCRECFAVLHLSRRNKGHKAHLIGSAASLCPKVDIHEGCTRLRLNNFLVLFNCAKLSGVVEIGVEAGALPVVSQFPHSFGQGGLMPSTSSGDAAGRLCAANGGRCRFCANPLKSESQQLCGQCPLMRSLVFRDKGETKCLPCFHCRNSDIRQDADDLCIICFVDRLGEAPCVQLKCGHFFHHKCVRTILERRWNGPRIVFRFMQCPLCKEQIDHTAFSDLLKPLMDLLEDVSKKAKLRLEYDGLLSNAALTTANSTFYNDPLGYAMERYMYVLCSKCHKAYFGGESRCQEELDSSINFNPEELVCGGCSDVAGGEICGRHGAEYLEYKCRFCCTVAVYFCFGTTHFCAGCHADFQRLMTLSKQQLPKCPAAPKAQQLPDNEPCPLKIQHPPTGEEFSLGCGICRNLHTF